VSLVAGWSPRATSSKDVVLFAGVVTGARLAAHTLVHRDAGRGYIETLDAVLGRLGAGIPLADAPIVPSS
jgi:hypothetical protein